MKSSNNIWSGSLLWIALSSTAIAQQQAVQPTDAAATPAVSAPAASATPAAITPAPAAAPAVANAKPAAEQQVVCRVMKVTGSRLRKERVCSSRGTSDNAQEWLKEQQDKGANEGSNAVVNGG